MAMKRHLVTLLLVAVGLLYSPLPAQAHLPGGRQDEFARRVKQSLTELGTGPSALVEVRLRDKTKLSGFVAEFDDDCFLVVDRGTGVQTTVDYGDVARVRGNNLTTGVKFAIWAAIGFAVIFAILAATSGD